MKKSIIVLIIGIIIGLLGGYLNIQFETQGKTVTATITEIKTDDDSWDTPATYTHYYYGEYILNGETYTNKKLTSHYTDSQFPKYHIGDTIEIVVNASKPMEVITDGSLLMFVGGTLIIFSVIILIKRKTHKL